VTATPPPLPRITAAGLALLARAATSTVHAYRDPGYPSRPGAGISQATLDRLRRDGLISPGDYVPLHGRPLVVTDLGHAVLAARTPTS
jgi:hypothetical protein